MIAVDERRIAQVGRTARLELRFAARSGRTVLAHAYVEPPFRVGRYFEDDGALHLILTSSSPGIFAGDTFRQTITLERGTRVRLTSQSALQVHPGQGDRDDDATLESTYHVDRDADLHCDWHPLIPFAGARLRQRIHLEVAVGASLFWSDAMMSGREARGERWRFAALGHELRLQVGGALAYLERYALAPGDGPDRRWIADRACYFGTVLAVGRGADHSVAEDLHRTLASRDDVTAAADLLSDSVMLVRLIAASGVPFHAARMQIAEQLEAQRNLQRSLHIRSARL